MRSATLVKVGLEAAIQTSTNPHKSISTTPSGSTARLEHSIIDVALSFGPSTKSRCSTSPETTPHLHTPQIPSEHFTSTWMPAAASASVGV
jgi:hypothetical protein